MRARRTSPTGPWSFRNLIEQMTPVGTDPADFAADWLADVRV
jgi:hypothetical protein